MGTTQAEERPLNDTIRRRSLAEAAQCQKLKYWCGIPTIVPDEKFIFSKTDLIGPAIQREVKAAYVEAKLESNQEEPLEAKDAVQVNCWFSRSMRKWVGVYHRTDPKTGKVTAYSYVNPEQVAPEQRQFYFQLATAALNYIWPVEAERKAQRLLRTLLSKDQYNSYFVSGSFIEESKKSGCTYVFRRLRPIIVYRVTGGRMLCALCSHGIGYMEDTFLGALCPTDDIIQNLMLLRADEARLWKVSGQHQPHTIEAGL